MASDGECNSDQENITKKLCIKEESTYPLNNKISYKECVNDITKRSFNYVIIKEGVYLDNFEVPINKQKTTTPISRNTKRHPNKHYKIPYDYIVETTWGRAT